jgi:hypothetical protein
VPATFAIIAGAAHSPRLRRDYSSLNRVSRGKAADRKERKESAELAQKRFQGRFSKGFLGVLCAIFSAISAVKSFPRLTPLDPTTLSCRRE